MNCNQNILNSHPEIFDLISVKNVTFLNEIDYKININKNGKFKYYRNFCFDLYNYKNFGYNLDNNTIYSLIPLLSKNERIDEPFTILSQTILLTKQSNNLLIYNYINNKIQDTIKLYNMNLLDNYYVIFKYKSVELDFESYKKFK